MPDIPTVSVDQLPTPVPESITVLDVREPVEWEQAHVPGSLHIPLTEVPARIDELPADSRLLVVCTVGGRSAQAVLYLQGQGLDAVNLEGGLIEWQSAGRELVSGP